jgi:hypothetical protein
MNWRNRPLTSHEVIVSLIVGICTRTGLTVSTSWTLASVDGTLIWSPSHDQRQCSLSTVSFAVTIAVGPDTCGPGQRRSEAKGRTT